MRYHRRKKAAPNELQQADCAYLCPQREQWQTLETQTRLHHTDKILCIPNFSFAQLYVPSLKENSRRSDIRFALGRRQNRHLPQREKGAARNPGTELAPQHTIRKLVWRYHKCASRKSRAFGPRTNFGMPEHHKVISSKPTQVFRVHAVKRDCFRPPGIEPGTI